MKEHEKPEVQLAIRSDGLDLHLNGPDVERRNRVLRALELGGPPGIVAVDPGFSPPAVAVVPRQPAPQQDDEGLVDGIRGSWRDIGPEWDTIRASAVLKYLRAQGLLRTPEDMDLVAKLERMKAARDATIETLRETEHERDTARAQLRALTAKAEEQNAMAERVSYDIQRLRADLDTTEQAYQRERMARVESQAAVRLAEQRAHEAGQEVAKLTTELLDVKRRMARVEEAAEVHATTAGRNGELADQLRAELDKVEKALAQERTTHEAAKRFIAAQGHVFGSASQAKAAQDG